MAGSPIFRRITLGEVKKTSNKRGSLLRELAGLEREEKEIIKNHHDPSYSNWRSSFLIEDGMNTKGFMQATFPAAGDTDFDSIDSTVDIEQFPDMTSNKDPAGPDGGNWPVQGVEIVASGSGSGDSGGFDIGTDYLAVNNAGSPIFNTINLNPIDCTKLDEIVVTAIRGNGSNGGATPTDFFADLNVLWQSPETLGDSGYPTWANMYNDASGSVVPDGATIDLYEEYGSIIPSSAMSKYDASHTGLREWKLAIPSWVRGKNISFALVQTTEGGLNYGITKIAFRRKSPISVFVSLDSPEAASFMRIGSPSKATDSKKKRERQLREQLEATKDYTDKKFGENFPGSEYSAPGEEDPTEVEKKAPRLGEFEPDVEDYSFNTWKQETKKEDPKAKTTEKEFEKWKDDKKLKSFAAVRDAQGEKETPLPSPTSDNKDFDTFSQGRTGQVMKDAQINAVQNMGGVDKIPADAPDEVKDLLTNKSPLKAVQNAITSFDKEALKQAVDSAPKLGADNSVNVDTALDAVVDTATGAVDAVAQGYEKAGVNKAGETFIKYLTNTLPDVLDNEYLGQKYVDQMIKQGAIDTDPDSPTYGTFQARENVIGGAQPPTYDPETGKISIKFNYDFKTNAQDFADKEAAGQEINPLSKLYHHSTGRYSSDASISSNIPILGGAINAVSGIVFGQLIDKAKGLGGGQGKPGEMTIDVEELKDKNYSMFMDLVRAGTIKNANEKIGEPAFTKTPQNLSQGERIAAAQKNADWKVLLKNLPSWFSTYGNPEVVEYRGVKGVWGNAYDGSTTFLTPTSERGPRGSSSSGYGTPGYDSATNTGGTLWQGHDADGPRGIDAFIDKYGLEPTQPIEWEGTPEQQEDLYKDLNDLYDTDPDRFGEVMQKAQDNPEFIKIQDEVKELQDILSGRNTKTKYGGIGNEGKPGTVSYSSGNPAADAAYADYEALQAKHKAEEDKRYNAMSKIKMFDVTLNPDGTAKSMDYTPQYEKALTAYNKFQSANRKEAGALYTSMKDIRTGQRGYKDIPSVDETRNRLKTELSQKMEQSIAIFDKNIYNALNPKIAGAGGSPGQPYTPPKEDPTNPYVPAPGRGTKVAQFPTPSASDAITGLGVKPGDNIAQANFGSIAQAYGGQGVDAATLASTSAELRKKRKEDEIKARFAAQLPELEKLVARTSKAEKEAYDELKTAALDYGMDVVSVIGAVGSGGLSVLPAAIRKIAGKKLVKKVLNKFKTKAQKKTDRTDFANRIQQDVGRPTGTSDTRNLTGRDNAFQRFQKQDAKRGDKFTKSELDKIDMQRKNEGLPPFKKKNLKNSYEPKGSMITERRKLKTPSQWFNPDDIKPEYPKDPPPEMVNNYHPDLVDSSKKAERFNKLDPASAKAMPKQDDPNIDAKVEKAKNNPDKDGPGWHKKVSDKIRMARAQQR